MKCKHSVDHMLLSFHDTCISHVTYVLGIDTATLNPHPNLSICSQSCDNLKCATIIRFYNAITSHICISLERKENRRYLKIENGGVCSLCYLLMP